MPAEGSLECQLVAEGVYAAVQEPGRWFVSNAGWMHGRDGLLAVDAFVSEARTDRLIAAIEAEAPSVSNVDPACGTGGTLRASYATLSLVVTHEHGDHANGAYRFEQAGFEVLASGPADDSLTAHGIQTFPGVLDPAPEWGGVRPPDRVQRIAESRTVDLGGVHAEVLVCPHHAHTSGDLVVREPSSGTVFPGDLVFHGVTPLAISGSVTGWRASIDWLAGLDPTVIVPGHGPVTPPAVLDEMRVYLDWIIEHAPSVADGANPVEISRSARAQGAPFPDWDLAERDAANLLVACADITGCPLDFPAALTAMLTANGGTICPPR